MVHFTARAAGENLGSSVTEPSISIAKPLRNAKKIPPAAGYNAKPHKRLYRLVMFVFTTNPEGVVDYFPYFHI